MQEEERKPRISNKLVWEGNIKTYKSKTTGDVIRDFYESLGLTQKEFADEIHFTPQAVSKWSCGDIPSSDGLAALRRVGLDLNMFFDILNHKEGQ